MYLIVSRFGVETMQRKAWKDTTASTVEASSGNWVKLENLVECKFTIVDVEFGPSNFDDKKEQANVTITYDEDEGTEMEGLEFRFSTTQQLIMSRLKQLTEDDIPVGPVTVFETGRSKQYGTIFYDLGDTIPDIDAPPPPKMVSNPANVRPSTVDVTQDAKRQRLGGQSLRSKSTR
jgi:hypothetical protein